jgi:hypothetical protein
MKLNLPAWLVASTTFSISSTVHAAGVRVRGKDNAVSSKQQRRVLEQGEQATYLVQDIQYEHDDSSRRLKSFENLPEEVDTVELVDGLIYTVEGQIPLGWTISGQGVILPSSTVIDDSTATITLPNANGGSRLLVEDADIPVVENSITEDQERNLVELRRQLAVTGDKTVLAVKIVLSNGSYSNDEGYLECKVFGTTNGLNCGDTYHLKNAYNDCSYGKLSFNKATARSSGSTSVSSISNGVVTVTLPNTTGQGDGVVRNAVTSALTDAFGTATGLADHLMYCLPSGTMSGIAYAYVNSWNSVYSNQWCNYVSAQVHEIGHNIGLAHSNEGSTTYADQSGMMGYSYGNESAPKMCFNAAKNNQLGWYADKTTIVTPSSATGNCFAGSLYGTAKYGDAAAQTVGIKVNNPSSSTDVYIMYNAQTGIQSGTQEGGNQVMVVTAGGEGNSYAVSTLVRKIITDPAGYTLPGFSNTKLYVDSNTAGSHASIRIETNGVTCGPVGPTPSPSPQPTPSPTTPQPTSPTNPPTAAPTLNCGDINVKSTCNNISNCTWEGNPNSGSCNFNSSSPPPPSPPSPTSSPPPPAPTPDCNICEASGECCEGTCVNKGNPNNRGCFL